jgi:CheY-like chemotaxis protein
MHNGHSHLLLVEDNPSDLRLTKEAFQDLEPLVILDAVSDGVEALAFLRREALTSVPFALHWSCSTSTFPKWMAGKYSISSRRMRA